MTFVTEKVHTVKAIPKNELGFICLSGVATRRFLALLLQGAPGWTRQRGRSH